MTSWFCVKTCLTYCKQIYCYPRKSRSKVFHNKLFLQETTGAAVSLLRNNPALTVNFGKLLRTPSLQNVSGRLLLLSGEFHCAFIL